MLKPASQTPLSALFLAELADEAGLPAGWLNVLVGPASEIGDVLVEDERVRATHVHRLRPCRLEAEGTCGEEARQPRARERDAGRGRRRRRLATAAEKVAANAFSFAGQSCISVQRVYVERPAYEAFVERFVPLVDALVVGNPADDDTDVGPVIDEDARTRVLEWIRDSKGDVLTGGGLDGDLIRPTVIANPDRADKVSCEEVFGPVCTVTAVDSVEEAFELANATRFGLQAGIFTSSLDTALRAAQALEFGGVTVNEAPTFRSDQMPYGGVKDSGNTREGPHYAVQELTEERLVVVELPS